MKKSTPYIRYSVLVVVAVVLSMVINTSQTNSTLGACLSNPVCVPEGVKPGTVTVTKYGFPVAYKEVTGIQFDNNAGSASAEKEGISVASIVISSLFWFGVLYMAADLIKGLRTKAAKKQLKK